LRNNGVIIARRDQASFIVSGNADAKKLRVCVT